VNDVTGRRGAEPQTIDQRVICCHGGRSQVVVEMALDESSVRPAAVRCTLGWYRDLSESSAGGAYIIEEYGVDSLVHRERSRCQPAFVDCTVDRYRRPYECPSCVMHVMEEQEVDHLVPNEPAHY
jgi:hypothetical protein